MYARPTSFEQLHLRCNPFGELLPDERAAVAHVDLKDHAHFLRAPRRALQLVADHGRGKSTHLLALHRRAFPAAPYTQLHAGDSPPAASDAAVQFIDSIENLRWWTRSRLYRTIPSLACTTHRDLSTELRRAGFTVRTVRVSVTSMTELQSIITRRVDWASTGTGTPPFPSNGRLEQLHRTFGDDVRSLEHELYLDYQNLKRDHGQVHTRAGTA